MKIAVIGSFIVDLMARAPHLPEPGETVMGTFFKSGPGGKGSNQAIAARRAGCDVMFATKLGRDDFARIARDFYQAEGLDTTYVFDTDRAATGTALISVDEQTRQNEIIVVPGACETFDEADIQRLLPLLDGCDYLLVQLEINLSALERLVDEAHQRGVRVILNPAPVQPLPDALYAKLYMVTPNEVEARILTDENCDTLEGCRRAAQVFLSRGVEEVIITLGKRGVYGANRSCEFTLENYDVPVVDTTGAGDAFNGGLLAGLARGLTVPRAAAFGNVVSNLAVTRIGTAVAMPSLEEIESFLSAHPLPEG